MSEKNEKAKEPEQATVDCHGYLTIPNHNKAEFSGVVVGGIYFPNPAPDGNVIAVRFAVDMQDNGGSPAGAMRSVKLSKRLDDGRLVIDMAQLAEIKKDARVRAFERDIRKPEPGIDSVINSQPITGDICLPAKARRAA